MNEEVEHSPPPQISSDTLKKIMWLYRTRTCPLNKRGQCNYGIHCFDSHELQPERRAPKQNEYNDWHPSTMKCTSSADESCKYGRACYFAHNDFEVNYHPTMYKTKICLQFDKENYCNLGMSCPNYHYTKEQRKIEKGSLSADAKSDGISRKAPPPQEFRRWLDEQLRKNKLSITDSSQSNLKMNGHGHNNNNNNNNINDNNKVNKLIGNNNPNITNMNRNNNNNNTQKDIISGGMNINGSSSLSLSLSSNLKLNSNDLIKTENEVEIELPVPNNNGCDVNTLNLSHSLIEDSPSTRFVSSAASSPYVEHIDEKWHQRYNNNNQSRPEHYIPSIPSQSPHLTRALSTPHSNNNNNNIPGPQPIMHSHSHHGNYSTKSHKSYNSSSSKHSKKSKNKSQNSKSKNKSKNSKHKSIHSKHHRTMSSKSSNIGGDRDGGRDRNRDRDRDRKKKINKKRENIEKLATEIMNTYKVNRCNKNINTKTGKCNDIYCDGYHNLYDKRRNPLQFSYIGEPCQHIYDNKLRKFTDNCYGCPNNEQCEYAHNYLEIWYHKNNFHTKRCPIQKYNKHCKWAFKCTHYHKKSYKRIINNINNNNNNNNNNNSNNINITHKSLSSTTPTIHSNGPQRPPLTSNRINNQSSPQIMSLQNDISSPYSAASFHSDSRSHSHSHSHSHFIHNNQSIQQIQQNNNTNGLISPHFDSNKSSPHNVQNDASYSYNPLMQGIAPSINSWRQKIDKNVGY